MRLSNALLVIVTNVSASTALIPDTHIKIEVLQDSKQNIAHEPTPNDPLDYYTTRESQ